MATIYVGLGSNIDPEKHLGLAVRQLREHHGQVDVSAVYRSAAVGFTGQDFLNLVARLRSEVTPEQICEEIERLHELSGRVRGGEKWASRPLDIDLLLYDDLVIDKPPVRVPRSDILDYSFVLRPLAELAPDLVHPVTGKTMLQHWQEFDEASHPLELAELIV